MFNLNNIEVLYKDLYKLFFTERKPHEMNKLNAYLDFYQFINFALSDNKDQLFRDFMRNLKKRKIDKEEKNSESKDILPIIDGNSIITNTNKFIDEEVNFLPMNFNLLLDYFNSEA